MQKRVFITGASAGIGLATTRVLIAAGYEVWGTSRSASRLPQDLSGFYPVTLDLNDKASIDGAFTEALAFAGGRFDVVINNAGAGWFGPGLEIPDADLHEQWNLLYFGPVRLMQLALPSLRSAPAGVVINITSLAARLPLPFGAAYSAAKAALSIYTAALQMEESAHRNAGEHAVRFLDLQPGDINTGFNRSMKFWSGIDEAAGQRARSLRKSLAASDRSLTAAPPPEIVAREILRVIEGTPPLQKTVGTFWQAVLGPLAYRFLPRRLLLWTIRKNCGL